MIISWQESPKIANQTSLGLQNAGAKVEHRHDRRTGTLDIILQEEEEGVVRFEKAAAENLVASPDTE